MVTDMQSHIDHYQSNNKQLRQQIKEAQIDLGITSEHELKAKKSNIRRDSLPKNPVGGEEGKEKETGQDINQLLQKQKQIDMERDKQSQKIIQHDQLNEWIARIGMKLGAVHTEEWMGSNEMFSDADNLVAK
jgi:hypothetical protein